MSLNQNSPVNEQAAAAVVGPAISLMILSGAFIVGLIFFFCFDIFLLATGMSAELQREGSPIPHETIVMIRMGFSVLLFVTNCFVFYGALNMKGMQKYSLCKTAAIISVVPCIAPCYILGIPFGIWALVVLAKPEVKDAFSS